MAGSEYIFTPLKLFNYLSLRVMLFFQTMLHSRAANELHVGTFNEIKSARKAEDFRAGSSSELQTSAINNSW